MTDKKQAGFTLIELIMALTITGIILITIVFMSTNAMRYQTESVFRNRATSAALYSLARMRRELEDATYLPDQTCGGSTLSGAGCNQVMGCTNWSNISGSAYGPGPVTTFYYCLSGTALYRYSQNGCSAFSPACGSPGNNQEILVPDASVGGAGIYHTDYPGTTAPIFQRSGDSALNVRYIVGYPGMKPNLPVPVDYLFNVRINTNKAYTDTND